MLKNTFFLLILLCLFSSCGFLPTQGLFTSPITENQEQAILFADDFSKSSSGWDRQRNVDGITDYENGQYLIQVNRTDVDYYANPSLSLVDVRLEVEAANASEVTDNDFGLICRFQNKNDFYAGLISSDGYYGIFKVKGGSYQLLGMEVMAQSPAIKTGSEKNQIRLDCVGQDLKLYVNGVQLDVRQDADFSKGDVGILAGAYQTTGVKIFFDNFTVFKP
jgi:hypothetical protein